MGEIIILKKREWSFQVFDLKTYDGKNSTELVRTLYYYIEMNVIFIKQQEK
jgi:hypothetical protein